MWYRTSLDATRGVERRSQRRYPLPLGLEGVITVRVSDSTVRVADVSLEGARLRGLSGIAPGQDLVLQTAQGKTIRSRCTWIAADQIGCRFLDRPAGLEFFALLMKALVPERHREKSPLVHA